MLISAVDIYTDEYIRKLRAMKNPMDPRGVPHGTQMKMVVRFADLEEFVDRIRAARMDRLTHEEIGSPPPPMGILRPGDKVSMPPRVVGLAYEASRELPPMGPEPDDEGR